MEDFALQSLPSLPVPPPPLSFLFLSWKKRHLYQSSDRGLDMCKALRLDSSLRGRQLTYRAKIKQYTSQQQHKYNTMLSDKKVPVRRNYSLPFFKHFIETKERDRSCRVGVNKLKIYTQ